MKSFPMTISKPVMTSTVMTGSNRKGLKVSAVPGASISAVLKIFLTYFSAVRQDSGAAMVPCRGEMPGLI